MEKVNESAVGVGRCRWEGVGQGFLKVSQVERLQHDDVFSTTLHSVSIYVAYLF